MVSQSPQVHAPKISVLTVCYNAAKSIEFSIESFLQQTYFNKELLIIDGGSSDRTLEIVTRYKCNEVMVVSENDRGLYHAMNKGLARFSGDAVGFLNADDKYHDETVLADIADALTKADVAFGNIDFVTDHSSRRVVRRWRGSEFKRGSFKFGWMAAHPTFYVRKTVVAAVGEFDERFKIAADYDYMLRALELQSFSAWFLNRVLVDMMAGGNSTRGLLAYVRGNIESLRSRQRWLGSGFVDLALAAKPFRKIRQFA
jgi:glycosyltransferase involved in cell wall biosynthesis